MSASPSKNFLHRIIDAVFPTSEGGTKKTSHETKAPHDTPSEQPKYKTIFTAEEEKGIERIAAVLFIDLKDFAQWSQHKKPQDVVYILNHFFRNIAKSVQRSGGWVDKYMGDGVLAIFGHQSNPKQGCHEAIIAAKRIDHEVKRVNAKLSRKVSENIKVGMGLHVGPLIIGRVGQKEDARVTTIGEVVNMAVGLEKMTDEKQCQIILTQHVVDQSKLAFDKIPSEFVLLQNMKIPIEVLCVETARDLPKARL